MQPPKIVKTLQLLHQKSVAAVPLWALEVVRSYKPVLNLRIQLQRSSRICRLFSRKMFDNNSLLPDVLLQSPVPRPSAGKETARATLPVFWNRSSEVLLCPEYSPATRAVERDCRIIFLNGPVQSGSYKPWPNDPLLRMAAASSGALKGISEAVLARARLVHGHAPVRDRLAVEALLLVQLMGRACATALHLPPLLNAFLQNVSQSRQGVL